MDGDAPRHRQRRRGPGAGHRRHRAPGARAHPPPGAAAGRPPAAPSQHDAARNTHRPGEGWAKSAVRAILRNPRYTGRQVWNKQRKDEILLDVNDVVRGYETRLRWNDTGQWIWSDTNGHGTG